MDGTSGDLLRSIDMSPWDPEGYIYDLSFVNSNLCWMLTYNVKGDSNAGHTWSIFPPRARFSETVSGGTTAAGDTTTFTVSLDTAGLSVGWQPLTLVFTSDDPDEPMIERRGHFHHSRGYAEQPSDRGCRPRRGARHPRATAPFILDLDGLGLDRSGRGHADELMDDERATGSGNGQRADRAWGRDPHLRADR